MLRRNLRVYRIVGMACVFCVNPLFAIAQSNDLVDLGAVAPGLGINNSGDVVLQNYLYSGGTLSPLPSGMLGAGINVSGQVVGTVPTIPNAASCTNNGDGGNCAIAIYKNGMLTRYPIFHSNFDPDLGNWGTGINASGSIVGFYTWVHFQGGAMTISNGTASDLAFPGSTCTGGLATPAGQAFAINDAGQITGVLPYDTTGSCQPHAFVFTQGAYQDLGIGTGYAINAGGEVTGSSFSPGSTQGVIYSGGATIILPGTRAGYGINAGSFVVGDTSSGAFFFDGIVNDLNNFVLATDPLKPYVKLMDARGINDTGLVVVNGVDSRTQAKHAYLLQVPLIKVTPGPLTFPSQMISTVSPPQTVTFTNAGFTAITLGALSISSGFSLQANDCGVSLAPSSSCAVQVAYAPMAAGHLTGTMKLLAGGVPFDVPLSGSTPLSVSINASTTAASTGAPVTLTWTAAAGASCSATGGSTQDGWTGSLTASGSKTVTENTAGSYMYGLTCSAGTQTQSAKVTVAVTMPVVSPTPSSSAHGGAFDRWSVVSLLLTVLTCRFVPRRFTFISRTP